jgi:hypothetical protein
MSRRSVVAGFAAAWTVSGVVALLAQTAPMTDADYAKTMKQIGPTFLNLQKDNATMAHAQGVKDAQALSDAFKQVQAYWDAKKAADAAGFARSAVAAADAIIKASPIMDMATIGDAQKTLSAACQSCHTAHREKLPDGSYKIK